jgi:hypothetical protein
MVDLIATLLALIALGSFSGLLLVWSSHSLKLTGKVWARARLLADILLTLGLVGTAAFLLKGAVSVATNLSYPHGSSIGLRPESSGADNIYWHGSSYSNWSNVHAEGQFVIMSTDKPSLQSKVNAERNDALSALQAGQLVHVYVCVYPSTAPPPYPTTQQDMNNNVDSLSNAGFLKDLNANSLPLAIVFDIEDSGTCGNWNDGSLSLDSAETQIQTFATWIKQRAQADGYNGGFIWGAVPGVNGGTTSPNNVTRLAQWLANANVQGAGLPIKPELFGPNVWTGPWDTYWRNILDVYIRQQGALASDIDPNYENALGTPDNPCYSASKANGGQSDIDSLYNEYVSVTGDVGNIHRWYVYSCPWVTN